MNFKPVTNLVGQGNPGPDHPHPGPRNHNRAGGLQEVDQADQGITSLGNTKITLLEWIKICSYNRIDAKTLVHLVQGVERKSRKAINWTRVGVVHPGPAVEIEVLT